MGTKKVEQLRIPADGTFTDNIEVRGMDVLIPDYAKNTQILHTFIFGDDGMADSAAGIADGITDDSGALEGIEDGSSTLDGTSGN
jgi:hypothetical protein